MPDEPTSIREALHAGAEAKDEPIREPAQTPTPEETPKESPEGDQDPTDAQERSLLKQFEKELAKLDPAERKGLVKKLANSDRKLQQLSQASAGLRRFAERLNEHFPNVTAEEVASALSSHRTRKPASEPAKRGIDAMIEQAKDPAVREELRESKRVMHEEFEDKLKASVEEAVKDLRQEVAELKSAGLSERSSVVESEIDALSDEEGFPDSFVEKYRDTLRAAAVKYRLPVLEVLPKVVPFADLKAALAEAKPPSSSEQPKPPSRPVTRVASSSTPANLEGFKDKRGGWDLRGALKAMAGR